MKTNLASLLLALAIGATVSLTHGHVVARDDASNYEHSDWLNGSNEGIGFTGWELTDGGDGGHFLGSSSDKGLRTPNIDTNELAFGMWHESGDATEAVRGFDGVWGNGSQLSFDFSFLSVDGVRGVELLQEDTVFFYFSVMEDGGYEWTGKNSAPATEENERQFGEILTFTFTQSAANVDYTVTGIRTSSPNVQGSVAGTLDQFLVYTSAGVDTAENELFINNFAVIPELSTYALLLLSLAAFGVLRPRRKNKPTGK